MSVQLHLGDCLDVLRTLPDGSVDAVVTDPPYNVGCKYDIYNDKRDDYAEWCREWFTECRRVAKQVIIFCGHGNMAMWCGIQKPSGIGCWFKPGNPARGGVFQFCEWEPFLMYGGRMSKSDVIRATITKQRDTGDHPCPKPLSLMVELLSRMKAQTILDPFCGTGTTGVACMQTGKSFIGCDASPHYISIAQGRIKQAKYANLPKDVIHHRTLAVTIIPPSGGMGLDATGEQAPPATATNDLVSCSGLKSGNPLGGIDLLAATA